MRNHSARLVRPMTAADHLRLTIGLKLPNLAAAQSFNEQVQDTASPLYHQYLTAAQWNARFAPAASSEKTVLDWAKTNHLTVTNRYANRLLVDVDGPVSAIDAALHVHMGEYTVNGRSVFSNDVDATLPTAVQSVVSSIDGLNNVNSPAAAAGPSSFPRYSAGPSVQAAASGHANGSQAKLAAAMAAKQAHPSITGGSYDPTDIYSSQAYDETAAGHEDSCCNPTNAAGSSPPNTSIAIVTAGKHNLPADMQGFQGRYNYLAYSYNEYYVDGTPSTLDFEGTMDLEWATAMSNSFSSFQTTAHVYLYSGVNANFSTFDDMYNDVLTDGHARIFSSSWGCAEDYCTPDATMNTDHNIFTAMIGQGYTLVDASDDKGAYSDCSHQSVQFPASDNNFIAVSATNLELNSSSQYVSERAWPANSSGCAHNGGGGGGGCSVKYSAPSYQLSPSNPNFSCGSMKSVPDLSLNGDWFNSPQNIFYNGGWSGNGGTSIAAPEFAGFMARSNSYLASMGNRCGSGSTQACAPVGEAGRQLYLAAIDHAAQGKNPYYDITSGCTSNDAGSGFCGIVGYDRATGWGSFNMLQLEWAINYWSTGEASAPTVTLSGPLTNAYTNTGTLSWSVVDNGSPTPTGVSGWTAKWDADPGDPTSHSTPGSGDSFYSGPASGHGSTSGSASLASAGSGCHTLYVRAWDNIGESAASSYGPVCYDATAPTITAAPKPTLVAGTKLTAAGVPVKVAWTATDTPSGIASYTLQRAVDGGAYANVALSPATATSISQVLAAGHSYQYRVEATDKAHNTSAFKVGTKFKVNLVQENAAGVVYSAGWTHQALAGSSGGSVDFSSASAKTAKFTFTGTQFAWVSTKGSNRGTASVAVDATPAVNVNTNNASTSAATIVFGKAFTASASHTVTVKNLGTAGHARIDVDAFVFFS
ncbi:MAG TPA: protease pro-enzyme activation domain-containing protein [Acidimicrobiia bacterium]